MFATDIYSVILNQEMKVVSASCRQGILTLAGCALTPVACEALEAILKKVRFQRIDLHDCQLNDDAAVCYFSRSCHIICAFKMKKK